MGFNAIGIVGRQVVKIASQGKFWACRHAPELLQAVGVIGFGGTVVAACKGTIKAREVLIDAKEDACAIEYARTVDPEFKKYTKVDERNDKIVAFVKESKGLAVSYAPAFILGGMTLSCFLGSSYILRKRNIALACAYSVLNDGFKSYRERVIEKYGEEEDYKLKTGIVTEKETVTEIDPDGKKSKKKVNVDYLDNEPSGYTFIFDDAHAIPRVDDPIIARDQLIMAQNSANNTLRSRGYITLNEVLRAIGLHETSAGQIVGWQTKGNGDGFVDFRIRQIRTRMDEGGTAFLLDFNVDGPIYQDIDKYTRLWGE